MAMEMKQASGQAAQAPAEREPQAEVRLAQCRRRASEDTGGRRAGVRGMANDGSAACVCFRSASGQSDFSFSPAIILGTTTPQLLKKIKY